jgi:hypothetical protein
VHGAVRKLKCAISVFKDIRTCRISAWSARNGGGGGGDKTAYPGHYGKSAFNGTWASRKPVLSGFFFFFKSWPEAPTIQSSSTCMKRNLAAKENFSSPAFQLQAGCTVLKMNRVAVSWIARVACTRGNGCSCVFVCVWVFYQLKML